VAQTETSEGTEATDAKKDTEGKKSGGIIGLIRSGSKALRGAAKKEKVKTPAAVEESKSETPAVEEPKTEEAKTAEPASEEKKPEEKPAIGDVVPEAVNVGTAPSATPAVTASA